MKLQSNNKIIISKATSGTKFSINYKVICSKLLKNLEQIEKIKIKN